MNSLSSNNLSKFAGCGIVKRDTKDGVRIFLDNGTWVLFRASGTEPVVRIYFESTSKKALKAVERSVFQLAQ